MKKIFLSILGTLIFSLFILLSIQDSFPSSPPNKNILSNRTNTPSIENVINPNNFQKAYVKRAVDGDTIVVTIDEKDYRVRLIGIDTPESTKQIEPYGKEASNYTSSILTGKTIYLEKDIRDTDKYDRLLRYVWLEIPNEISADEIKKKLFNANLLINGYATLFTYPPDIKYVEFLTLLEREAKRNKIGLWKIEEKNSFKLE